MPYQNGIDGYEHVERAKRKVVTNVVLQDDEVKITLEDGSVLTLHDDGQSCCETRYLTTDDDARGFLATHFLDVFRSDIEVTNDEYGDPHEITFLRIQFGCGTLVVSAHNEHNGYYGGFSIRARLT